MLRVELRARFQNFPLVRLPGSWPGNVRGIKATLVASELSFASRLYSTDTYGTVDSFISMVALAVLF